LSIERIIKDKQPSGFILENVEGLVKHDRGQTLSTILNKLRALNYHVNWKVLNSLDFGIPQERKRVYLVGSKDGLISLDFPQEKPSYLQDILETGLPTLNTKFIDKILSHYSIEYLYGREDNIHSWDLELKGKVSEAQKQLLNLLLKERRKKIWAENKGIVWMDGMPLTLEEITSFYCQDIFNTANDLQEMLEDLVKKDYLRYEHPKDLVQTVNNNGRTIEKRQYRQDLPKGYNIVTGKLSFEINKILDPHGFAPTLVATDMSKLAVIDGKGIRKLSIREGLRLFGFPETYKIDSPIDKAYDLLGNTVIIPIIQAIAKRLILQSLQTSLEQNHRQVPVCSK
jgi:DNA (cytosine-5)-methyltransferase 1